MHRSGVIINAGLGKHGKCDGVLASISAAGWRCRVGFNQVAAVNLGLQCFVPNLELHITADAFCNGNYQDTSRPCLLPAACCAGTSADPEYSALDAIPCSTQL